MQIFTFQLTEEAQLVVLKGPKSEVDMRFEQIEARLIETKERLIVHEIDFSDLTDADDYNYIKAQERRSEAVTMTSSCGASNSGLYHFIDLLRSPLAKSGNGQVVHLDFKSSLHRCFSFEHPFR